MNHTTRAIALPLPRLRVRTTRRARLESPPIPFPWRETLWSFSAYAGPVLAFGVLGFATVNAITQLIMLFSARVSATDLPLSVALAAVGLASQMVARGAMAQVGLGDDGSRAFRAALSRWRHLLVGSLVRAVITAAAVLAFAPLLAASDLGAAARSSSYPNPDGMMRQVISRGVGALIAEPLDPMRDLLDVAQRSMLQTAHPVQTVQQIPAGLKWMATQLTVLERSGGEEVPSLVGRDLLALAGIMLLIGAEMFLRFYPAAAMSAPANQGQPSFLSPLVVCVWMGFRYFRPVLVNAVVLRLLLCAFQVVGVILPAAVVENLVLPQLAWTINAPWLTLICRVACILCTAMVNAILTSLVLLYDSRLYIALQIHRRDAENAEGNT